MAGKGVKIPVGIDFDSKDFIKDITIAASASGKALEKELSTSISHSENTIKRFSALVKQTLSTGILPEGMSAKEFKAIQTADKAAKTLLTTYSQIMSESNEFSTTTTAAYNELSEKIESTTHDLEAINHVMNTYKENIREIQAIKAWESTNQNADEIIRLYEELENRTLRLQKSLETAKESASKTNFELIDLAKTAKEAGNLELSEKYLSQIKDTDNNRFVKSFKTQLENTKAQRDELGKLYEMAKRYRNAIADLSEKGINAKTDLDEQYKYFRTAKQFAEEYNATLSKLKENLLSMEVSGSAYERVGISPEKAELLRSMAASALQYAKASEEAGKHTKSFNNNVKTAVKHGKTFGKIVKSITNKLREMVKHLIQVGHHTRHSFDSSRTGIKGLLRNVMRYGLGIRSLYFLFRRLRAAAKEAFGVMAQQWDPVNQQISSMIQALNGVKGSIATMLQPLLAGFASFFNQFMAILQKVMETIGAFFAMLTGQNYILRAKAGGVNWAESLADNLGRAKDEAEELNKQLAGFDKLNNLTTKDTSDSGSGKPDIGLSTVTFEKVPIEQLDLFQWLKEMWDKSDFSDLGRYLNEKITGWLEKLDWTAIEDMGRKIGKCIATALNGFFENKNLADELGEAIAGMLNTAFATIGNFATNFKWDEFGEFIKRGINSFLENAKTYDWGFSVGSIVSGLAEAVYRLVRDKETWSKLGKRISEGINGFIESMGQTVNKEWVGFGMNHVPIYEELNGWQVAGRALSGFATGLLESMKEAIKGVDWQKLGEGIADFISSIDWTQIVIDMSGLAWQLLVSLLTAWKGMTDRLMESDNPFASSLGLALKTTFKTTFKGAEWLSDQTDLWINMDKYGKEASDAFTKAFKEKYGEKSIAQVIEEQGTIDNSVYEAIQKDMEEKGHGAYGAFFEGAFREATTSLSYGDSDIEAQFWSIIGGYTESMLIDKADKLAEVLEKKNKEWGENSGNAYNKGMDDADVVGNVEKTFGGLEPAVKGILAIGSPSKVFYDMGEDTIAGFLGPFDTLQSKFTSIWESVKNGALSVVSGMQSALSSMAGSILGIINSLATGMTSIFNGIINGFNSLSGLNLNISGIANAGLSGATKGIPHLATGAVIPPNSKFLAMLGDQTSGTNVEAPLSTIEQAVRNVMAEQNINVTFEVQGDPEHIFNVVRKQSNQFTRRTGLNWT